MAEELKILLKIPTRGRGLKHLHQWWQKCHDGDNIEMIISVDDDDWPNLVNEWAFSVGPASFPGTRIYASPRTNKIHAFNRDIDKAKTDWDILVIGQDDLQVMQDWDKIIRGEFADINLDKAIWFDCENDDLFNTQALPHLYKVVKGSQKFLQNFICMHPVMGRKLYERIGYVYNPVYENFFCDNEFTKVLQANKRLHYVQKMPFLHLHASYPGSHAEADATYSDAAKTFYRDKQTFQKRKNLMSSKWKN